MARSSGCRSPRSAIASDRYLIESYDIHYVAAIGALSSASLPARAAPATRRFWSATRARTRAVTASWRCRRCPGRGVRSRPSPDHADGAPRRRCCTGPAATEARRARRASPANRCSTSPPTESSRTRNACRRILLSPGQPAAGRSHRGRLAPTAVSPPTETYDLELDADLIVLSGCRTALGPIMGDGVIGFTRGFLAAGASSVVATMWDVPDRTSFEVMTEFYRAWAGTGTASGGNRAGKSRALQAGTADRTARAQGRKDPGRRRHASRVASPLGGVCAGGAAVSGSGVQGSGFGVRNLNL